MAVTEAVEGRSDRRRLMLVHAHPDDESINNGATMARYAAEGAEVCLVTCTLGEEGEVLVPELAHLAAAHTDDLGGHRLGELKQAMDILGVTDFVRLGGDGRFRDSGMAWHPEGLSATVRTELRSGIFWSADLLEAANELVPLIRSRRPQVLVGYDEFGGYGHPDHVQAHRVTMYGYLLAGVPSFRPDLGPAWSVPRVLWTAMSESRLRADLRRLRAAGDHTSWGGIDPDASLPSMVTADDLLDVMIDGTGFVDRKIAAMRAHATQITPDGQFFTGVAVLGSSMWAYECYRLAAGLPFPPSVELADDLFAGLA